MIWTSFMIWRRPTLYSYVDMDSSYNTMEAPIQKYDIRKIPKIVTSDKRIFIISHQITKFPYASIIFKSLRPRFVWSSVHWFLLPLIFLCKLEYHVDEASWSCCHLYDHMTFGMRKCFKWYNTRRLIFVKKRIYWLDFEMTDIEATWNIVSRNRFLDLQNWRCWKPAWWWIWMMQHTTL